MFGKVVAKKAPSGAVPFFHFGGGTVPYPFTSPCQRLCSRSLGKVDGNDYSKTEAKIFIFYWQ